jgi:hypothetical protein
MQPRGDLDDAALGRTDAGLPEHAFHVVWSHRLKVRQAVSFVKKVRLEIA